VTTTGSSADQVFRGPGAFYLAAEPDVIGKEPDDPNKPTGLLEVPCDAPADAAGSGAPAPAADPAAAQGSGSGTR
jgi:hypothetical protein